MNSTAVEVKNITPPFGFPIPDSKSCSENLDVKNFYFGRGLNGPYIFGNQDRLYKALNKTCQLRKFDICVIKDTVPTSQIISSCKLDIPFGIGSAPINNLSKQSKTRVRKKSQKSIDYCLLPKKGTAKPRQSRQRMSAKKTNTGKGNPKSKDCYTGARVKETVREKLDRLRAKRRSTEQEKEKLAYKRRNPYVTTPPRRASGSTVKSFDESSNQHTKLKHSWSGPSHTGELLSETSHRLGNEQVFEKVCQLIHGLDSGELSVISFSEQLDVLGPIENIPCDKEKGALLHYVANNGLTKGEPSQLHNRNESMMITLCNRFSTSGINRQNDKGETPLHVAVTAQNIGAIIGLLKSSANPRIREFTCGDTVFHRAVRTKNIRILNTLLIFLPVMDPSPLEFQNVYGNTPLHNACEMLKESNGTCNLSRQIVSMLMNQSTSMNVPNLEGVTPYMIWSMCGEKVPQQSEYRLQNSAFSEEEYKLQASQNLQQPCSSTSTYYPTFDLPSSNLPLPPTTYPPSINPHSPYRSTSLSPSSHQSEFSTNPSLPLPPQTNFTESPLPYQQPGLHQIPHTTTNFSYSFNNSNNTITTQQMSPVQSSDSMSPRSAVFNQSPGHSSTSSVPFVSVTSPQYQDMSLPNLLATTTFDTLPTTSALDNPVFTTYSCGFAGDNFQSTLTTAATTQFSSCLYGPPATSTTAAMSSEDTDAFLDDITELFCDDI